MAAKDIPQKLHEFPWSPYWRGKRLKEVVRTMMPNLGSRHALLVITNGLVRAGGKVHQNADDPMPENADLAVDLRHGVHGRGNPDHPHLHERMKVIHDDEHLVVVSKNSGTIVQPTRDDDDAEGRQRTAPLVELLKHYWRANSQPPVNPIVVQRLDMNTSGLMVLAKTADAGRALQRQLKPPRKLRREYLAIVAGDVQTDSGVWKTYLAMGKIGLRQSVGAGSGRSPSQRAQLAETHFEVEERFGTVTLLRLKLETGRTHQIRIHCAEAGHPVLGDHVYTRLAENVIERVAKGKAPTAIPDHPFQEAEKVVRTGVIKLVLPKKVTQRLALHATKLSFIHPATRGKRMSFEDPLPGELKNYVKKLRTPAPGKS
jgi:23S rRNA pseudouridine1911/1915/1917 synthase